MHLWGSRWKADEKYKDYKSDAFENFRNKKGGTKRLMWHCVSVFLTLQILDGLTFISKHYAATSDVVSCFITDTYDVQPKNGKIQFPCLVRPLQGGSFIRQELVRGKKSDLLTVCVLGVLTAVCLLHECVWIPQHEKFAQYWLWLQIRRLYYQHNKSIHESRQFNNNYFQNNSRQF
jgi:hypothetical protein